MQISELNIYPVKSLKGIALTDAVVEKRGLRYDRRWMLTDPDGMFFTQRDVPKMAAVTVAVDWNGLTVSADGVGSIHVPQEPDQGTRQQVTVWQSDVDGLVYNGPVSEWFSDVLSKKCQLVLMPDTSERHVSERFDTGDDIVSFADGYPLLLIGEGSLDELNERIMNRKEETVDEDVRVPYPMNRFRPNLVVKGSEPFAEDTWARIKVGEAIFRVAKPCARCVMTTVDQTRGEFDGKDPLKTMATFRMAKDAFPTTYESFDQKPNAVLFGENLIPENPGAIVRLGDPVEILETRKLP